MAEQPTERPRQRGEAAGRALAVFLLFAIPGGFIAAVAEWGIIKVLAGIFLVMAVYWWFFVCSYNNPGRRR